MLESQFDYKLYLFYLQINFENLKVAILRHALDYEFFVFNLLWLILQKWNRRIMRQSHRLQNTSLGQILLHFWLSFTKWTTIRGNTNYLVDIRHINIKMILYLRHKLKIQLWSSFLSLNRKMLFSLILCNLEMWIDWFIKTNLAWGKS